MTQTTKTQGEMTSAAEQARPERASRTMTLTGLMRAESGATAAELAAAVGWQVHSVRGFISGTLKKRVDLEVIATKVDGVMRYQLRDRDRAQ
jgi:hypothetical protein